MGAPLRAALEPTDRAGKQIAPSVPPTGAKILASCAPALEELTRQLRHDSCLTEREIREITGKDPKVRTIPAVLSEISIAQGTPYRSEIERIKRQISKDFETIVTRALAHRSTRSNLIEFLENDPDSFKIASPNDRVRIESRGDVTLADLKRVQDMFEPLLSTENVPMSRWVKELMRKDIAGDEDTIADVGVTVTSASTAGAQRAEEDADADEQQAVANSRRSSGAASAASSVGERDAEELSAAENIADPSVSEETIQSEVEARRGKSDDKSTLPTIKMLSRFSENDASPDPDVAVTEKIRTGETFETLHNFMLDKASLKRDRVELLPYLRENPYKRGEFKADPRIRRIRQRRVTNIDFESAVKSSPTKIASEIETTIRKLKSTVLLQVGQPRASIDSSSEKTQPEIRGEVEFLSGLFEYLAMSGVDVTLDEALISARTDLLSIARDLHSASLEMTDAIAKSSAEMTHTYTTTAEISKQIDKAKKNLAVTQRNAQEARRDSDLKRAARLEADADSQQKNLEALIAARSPYTRAGIISKYNDAFRASWDRARSIISGESLVSRVNKFVGIARQDEDKVSDSSDLSIRLAKQRIARAKNLETSIIAEITRAAGSAGVSKDILDSVGSASEKYSEQVARTVRRIAANNSFQIHHLRLTDTIDSICEEYRVGEASSARDMMSSAHEFVAALPKYVSAGASATPDAYVTMGVVPFSEEEEAKKQFPAILSKRIKKRDPVIKLKSKSSGKDVYVLLSDAIAAANAETRRLKPEEAREKFSRELTYIANRALPLASGGAASVSPLNIDPTRPLIPQLADRMAERAKSVADERFRAGLRELAQSCEEQISKPFDPAADRLDNAGLIRFLGMVLVVARGVGRDSEVTALIEQSFSGYPSIIRSAINKSEAISGLRDESESRHVRMSSEDVRIVDAVSDILESLNSRSIIGSIVSSLSMMAGARTSWLAVEKDATRTGGGMSMFDRRLIDMIVPVPSRSILTPGTSVTVRSPSRRIGDSGMHNMRYLGLGFNSLRSQPTLGFISAIKQATFAEIIHPILESLCDEAADAWTGRVIDMLVGSAGAGGAAAKMRAAVNLKSDVSLTPSDKAVIRDSLRKGVHELFVLPEARVGRQDVEGIRRAYSGFNKFLGKKYVLMSNNTSLAAADSDADSVQMRVKDLMRVAQDAAARMIFDERGATRLAQMVPCTVALLDPGSASAEGKILLSLLTPSKEGALRTMSPASYRNTVLGVRRGRTGRQAIFGYEIERISLAVKLLNDFFESLDSDTGPDRNNITPMIERAKSAARRQDKSLGDKVPPEKICEVLGIPANSSVEEINERCKSLRRTAALEVSHLSDVKGKFTDTIRSIIAERSQDKSLNSLKTLLSRYISGNSEYDSDSLIESVNESFMSWVNDVPIPDPVDIKTAASLASKSRSANNALVSDGIPQMLSSFVSSVVETQMPIYRAQRSRSLMPYEIKQTQERT